MSIRPVSPNVTSETTPQDDFDLDAILEEVLDQFEEQEEYKTPSNMPMPLLPETTASLEQMEKEIRKETEAANEAMKFYEGILKGKNLTDDSRKKLFDFALAVTRQDMAAIMQAAVNLPSELQEIFLEVAMEGMQAGSTMKGMPDASMMKEQEAKLIEIVCKEVNSYLEQKRISPEDRKTCLAYMKALKDRASARAEELQQKLPKELFLTIAQKTVEFFQSFGSSQETGSTEEAVQQIKDFLKTTDVKLPKEQQLELLSQKISQATILEVENYLNQEGISTADRRACLGHLQYLKDPNHLLTEIPPQEKLPEELERKLTSKLGELATLLSPLEQELLGEIALKELTPEVNSWNTDFRLASQNLQITKMATLLNAIPPAFKEDLLKDFDRNAGIGKTLAILDLYKKDKAALKAEVEQIHRSGFSSLSQSDKQEFLKNGLSLLGLTRENAYTFEEYMMAMQLGSCDLLRENQRLIEPYAEFDAIFMKLCQFVDPFTMFLKARPEKDQNELLPRYRSFILQNLRPS